MVCALSSASDSPCHVLCANMEAAGITAAVLRTGMPLEELRDVKMITLTSKPWWGADCPRLFDRTMPESLAGRIQYPYEAISLNISGLVVNQQFLSSYKKVPSDLKAQCESCSGMPHVRIENDAVAWARGAAAVQARLGSPVEYPALFVTFGAGPGAAVITEPGHYMDLELYFVDWPFSATNACRGGQPAVGDKHFQALIHASPPKLHKDTANAYALLSDMSLKWIRSESSEDEKVRQVFTTRVCAYLQDIMDSLEHKLQIKVKTVLVGGRNAELVNTDQLSPSIKESVHVFSDAALKTHGIAPDLVSLIGSCDGIGEPSTDAVFPDSSLVLAKIQAITTEYSK